MGTGCYKLLQIDEILKEFQQLAKNRLTSAFSLSVKVMQSRRCNVGIVSLFLLSSFTDFQN